MLCCALVRLTWCIEAVRANSNQGEINDWWRGYKLHSSVITDGLGTDTSRGYEIRLWTAVDCVSI